MIRKRRFCNGAFCNEPNVFCLIANPYKNQKPINKKKLVLLLDLRRGVSFFNFVESAMSQRNGMKKADILQERK